MIRQVISALATIWLAATLAFFALRVLPGDALTSQLTESGISPQIIEARRAALGLDDPLFVQYARYLAGLLRGDLGVSLLDGRPVTEIVAQQFPPTLALALTALTISAVGGIALGVVSALEHQNAPLTVIAPIARLFLDLSLSMPLYWTGTLAIYAVTLVAIQGLSTSGLILPALVLGFSAAGAVGQVVLSSVSVTFSQDFVRTARGKGLSETRVVVYHVLRAGLLPVVTVIALQGGFLLGGVVITESLFVRPGIGRVLLSATMQQDYPVVQGIVVLGAVVYILLNTAADALYRLLDPRV